MLAATVAAFSSLFAASPAGAGDFEPRRVAADAKWLAFIDVEGILHSTIGKFMLERGDELGFEIEADEFDEIETQFGVHPLKDLRSVTIYGSGDPEDEENFIALFETSAAVDDALAQLTGADEQDAGGAPNINTIELAGQKVHLVGDGKQTAYFQIRPGRNSDERLVIVSMSRERITQGLAVLEGKAAALAGDEPASVRSEAPQGVLVFASFSELDWVDADDDDPASALLRGTRGLDAAIGEREGELFVDVELETSDKEDAQNLGDMTRGLIGMARMAVSKEAQMKPMLEPMRSVKLTTEGSTIALSVRHDSQALIDALKAMADISARLDDDDDQDDDDEGKIEVKASIGVKKGAEKSDGKKTSDPK